MKKTRKPLALLIALAIALSVLAFPAAAAVKPDEESVLPESAMMICITCNGAAPIIEIERGRPGIFVAETSCAGSGSMVDNHEYVGLDRYVSCRNCGDTYLNTWYYVYCFGKLIRVVKN